MKPHAGSDLRRGTHLAAATGLVLDRWRDARKSVIRANAARRPLHRWRVCSRQLFALDELLGPAVTGPHRAALQNLLRDAFHAAGRLRDAQVAMHRLRQLAPRFPAADRLARTLRRDLPRRRARVTRRIRAVRPRDVRGMLASRGILPAPAVRRAAARAARRLLRARQRVQRAASHCRTAHALHRCRLQLKALRYMQDFSREARLHMPPGRDAVRKIDELQQLLGSITDLQALLELIDRFGARHPRWSSKAASLRQHLRREQRELRTACGNYLWAMPAMR